MASFCWMGSLVIPPEADLRQRGWHLREDLPSPGVIVPDCVTLVDARVARLAVWRRLWGRTRVVRRRWVLVLGVANRSTRARLLGLGFGDVLGGDVALAEVDLRARRVATMAEAMPRWKSYGPLRLDLLARDAFIGRRGLGLYPREFALLWRLMESPGVEVGKQELLRDLWHLSFVPDTNSLAVHAHRLRAKLALVGLGGWVQTASAGGYFLAPPPSPAMRRMARRRLKADNFNS